MIYEAYYIYHALGITCTLHSIPLLEYKYIGIVYATSLENAFKAAQNDFNPSYAKYNTRSTSVGDIIMDSARVYHQVDSIGFKPFIPTL